MARVEEEEEADQDKDVFEVSYFFENQHFLSLISLSVCNLTTNRMMLHPRKSQLMTRRQSKETIQGML